MSSFTTQPNADYLHGILKESEGGTLNYVFETTVLANTHVPALTVEYLINGVKLYEADINGYETRTQTGSDYDYTYNIDASQIVKQAFDSSAAFNVVGTPTQKAGLKSRYN